MNRTKLEDEVVQNILKELDRLPDISFRKTYSAGVGYAQPWFIKVSNRIHEREIVIQNMDDDKSEKQCEQRKQRDALIKPQIIKWAQKNLKKGMRVWVSGARDGIGYREVIEVRSEHSNEWFRGQQLVADRTKGTYYKRLAKKEPQKYNWILGDYVMDIMLDKIVAVDVKGKRTSIYDLL